VIEGEGCWLCLLVRKDVLPLPYTEGKVSFSSPTEVLPYKMRSSLVRLSFLAFGGRDAEQGLPSSEGGIPSSFPSFSLPAQSAFGSLDFHGAEGLARPEGGLFVKDVDHLLLFPAKAVFLLFPR